MKWIDLQKKYFEAVSGRKDFIPEQFRPTTEMEKFRELVKEINKALGPHGLKLESMNEYDEDTLEGLK